MSSITMSMHRYGEGDIFEVAKQLWREISQTAELICLQERYGSGGQAILLSCEKYFFRNGSYASLNVMLTEFDGVQRADIVGSGGGEGIFNFSLWANDEFAEDAQRALGAMGFTVTAESEE